MPRTQLRRSAVRRARISSATVATVLAVTLLAPMSAVQANEIVAPSFVAFSANPARSSSDEATILRLVNRARISHCLPVLNRNGQIDVVARSWSMTMARTGRFVHNPRYSQQYPGGWTRAAENVAAGYRTGNAMFDGWMRSPGHRANILHPEFTDIGIGFVTGGSSAYSTYGTQNFAAYPAHRGGQFLDVRPWHQFYGEIEWMARNGYSTGNTVSGCDKTTYAPSAGVSRDAMAAFLYRFAGEPAFTPPAVSPFRDVPRTHQFYKQITWLASTGISKGWSVPGGHEFRPSQTITRDAMATFMYRYANEPSFTPPSSSPFRDVPRTHQFYKEVTWLSHAGISTGWSVPGGSEFRSSQWVTRDAMAAFLQRLNGTG